MMQSFNRSDLSLPVRLNFYDGRTITVRLVYSGCNEAVLMIEGGATIPRSAIHSAGITFSFADELQLAA